MSINPLPKDADPTPLPAADTTAYRTEQRRLFLKQASLIAGVGLGCGWTALAPSNWPLSLRDPDGEQGKPREPVHHLPEKGYAVSAKEGAAALGVAQGENIEAMLASAVDGIGGIRHFIRPGDIVVLKPNVAFERPAALGATTNPEVLSACIRLVRQAGASEVRVVDNPIESPESCFVRSGIQRASLEAGARVYLPVPGDFELLNTPGAKWIERWPFFWRPFRDANKVIGIAPVKDHNLCQASMTTKNWYGLLGGRRNQFHQDIHGIITDLARMLRPTFVILDGTRVLFRSGPTGGSLADVKMGHTIVASQDSLAADAYGWDMLLDRSPADRPAYLAQSAQAGFGDPRWRQRVIRTERVG